MGKMPRAVRRIALSVPLQAACPPTARRLPHLKVALREIDSEKHWVCHSSRASNTVAASAGHQTRLPHQPGIKHGCHISRAPNTGATSAGHQTRVPHQPGIKHGCHSNRALNTCATSSGHQTRVPHQPGIKQGNHDQRTDAAYSL